MQTDIQMWKDFAYFVSYQTIFPSAKRILKKVLEWQISNLKLACEEEVKVFLKQWVQL